MPLILRLPLLQLRHSSYNYRGGMQKQWCRGADRRRQWFETSKFLSAVQACSTITRPPTEVEYAVAAVALVSITLVNYAVRITLLPGAI